jgi:hypothetical protein
LARVYSAPNSAVSKLCPLLSMPCSFSASFTNLHVEYG